MPTYSLLGPMHDQPYALGERPGGSDIPSIPLLTGRDAWNSISSHYDGRHMDTRLRPDVNHTIAPRPTDSPLDKKAMAEKLARGGGILRMLRRLIPQSPGPLPPGRGVNELLARQRTQIRGQPYKRVPASTRPTPSTPRPGDMAKMRLALLGPATLAAGGAGLAAGHQAYRGAGDYAAQRRLAAQPMAQAPAAEPASTEPTGTEPSPVAPDALAKAKDFFQTHGTQLGVGAASGVGLYALYKILQNLTTSKEEKRQRAFEMLPKAAEADPGQFCEEFPRLAGFLCYCHNMDLDDEQIAAGIEKAGNTIHEFDIELVKLEKLAAGLEGEGLGGWAARQLRGGFRGVKGLRDVGVGGMGTFATGAPWLLSEGYNQTAGRLGAPKIPNQALGGLATDYAAVGRGGLKDIVGAKVNMMTRPQDLKYMPQVAQQWAQSPGEASKAYEASWGRGDITEAGRNLGRGLKSTSDVLATSVPFVAAGGIPGIAGKGLAARAAQGTVAQAPIATSFMGEGPWAEADKGFTELDNARARAQAGPPAGQNPNIPGAPGAPGTPAEPADSTAGLDPNKLNNLPPEQAQGARQAADQAAAIAQQDAEAGQAAANEILSPEPNTPADQQGQGNLTKQLGDPQTAMEMYQQMDPGAKWLLWGGLALGAIGLLSALADEEGGGLMSWIMTLLGVGGALGAAGHGGFLGQGAQQGIQGLMGQITGKQQPPPAPSAATQAARRQIEWLSAGNPGAGLTALREDGLSSEESREMLANPGMRQYLMSLPDEEAMAVMNEAAVNPEIAELLQQAATSEHARNVLTGPEGERVVPNPWGSWLPNVGPKAHGWAPGHADRFIEIAKQREQTG